MHFTSFKLREKYKVGSDLFLSFIGWVIDRLTKWWLGISKNIDISLVNIANVKLHLYEWFIFVTKM